MDADIQYAMKSGLLRQSQDFHSGGTDGFVKLCDACLNSHEAYFE